VSSYHAFTSVRSVAFDPSALQSGVRTACGDDAASMYMSDASHVVVKKAAEWTPQQIASTQVAIDACPSLTPQRGAQNEIDAWPISMKAFALALFDQINVLRQAAGLQPVTPAQAMTAIRNKAATL
jgi:hypothetical protein